MPRDDVLDAAVQRASAAVTQTAASPNNDMSGAAVAAAQPELRASIEAALAPVIQNLTNTEPHFWMKRTFWSQVGSGLAVLSFIATPVVNYLESHTTSGGSSTITAVGLLAAVWAGYAAYRAGHATTPLGTPSQPPNPVPYRG